MLGKDPEAKVLKSVGALPAITFGFPEIREPGS